LLHLQTIRILIGSRRCAERCVNIDDLTEGAVARIVALAGFAPELEAKLREIGFCEGDEVQLLTRGPLGGQPLAVRLNRRIVAMRRDEARAILVECAL
jgi:ferrous iron transport protein A